MTTVLRLRRDVPNERGGTFVLTVLTGPDAGATVTIDANTPECLVGQSASCQLRLTDNEVSRRHFTAEATATGLRVVDLSSTNGTFCNRVRIGEAYLCGGERLEIGQTTIEVALASTQSQSSPPTQVRFGRVLGGSHAMQRIYPLCERLAQSDASVVVEGETGTGKELLAESLHEQGPRAAGPFVVFDCTAVPPTLVESTLFGHERGAFTGAIAIRKGVFELAHGGTLLIDEIGELDLNLQPKLLRALERAEVQRIGADQWRKVDVRVIAATRRNLDEEVQAGRFREDLYYRLAVARIALPPLRERHGDIGLLVRHFWRKLDSNDQPLTPAILENFERYLWPGNVRELRNAVVRRLTLGELADAPDAGSSQAQTGDPSSGDERAAHDVIQQVLDTDLPLPLARERIVAEFERRYVALTLAKFDGNVTRAAQASGIARRYFYTLRARHGV